MIASADEDYMPPVENKPYFNTIIREKNDTIIDDNKCTDSTENSVIQSDIVGNPPPAKYDNDTTTTAPKIEWFGIAGFSTGLVGLILVYIEPIALILAIISLVRFRRNPGKYKGKGFAIGTIFMALGLSVTLLLLWILLLIIVM
ncbi:MAG: DUF4190 domain-containing protein [Bacteroidales bacterium]|nr:DUF4190 domain-containing protein [Bacteroidales bacterium]